VDPGNHNSIMRIFFLNYDKPLCSVAINLQLFLASVAIFIHHAQK
jgi:hypothetical protein